MCKFLQFYIAHITTHNKNGRRNATAESVATLTQFTCITIYCHKINHNQTSEDQNIHHVFCMLSSRWHIMDQDHNHTTVHNLHSQTSWCRIKEVRSKVWTLKHGIRSWSHITTHLVVLFLVGDLFKKDLTFRHFKLNQDEIWQDCSSRVRVRFLTSNFQDVAKMSACHLLQGDHSPESRHPEISCQVLA